MTITELLAQAQVIYDETEEGANTHQRIGQMFIDIIDTLAKRAAAPITDKSSGNVLLLSDNTSVLTSDNLVNTAVRFYPVLVPVDMTVVSLSVENTTSTAGNMRLALYNDNGAGYPGAIHPSFPSTDFSTAATGVKTITPGAPVTLEAGMYWIGIYVDVTVQWRAMVSTAHWRKMENSPGSITADAANSNYFDANTYATLPDPAPAGMGNQAGTFVAAWFTF